MNKIKLIIAAVATIFSYNVSAQKLVVADLQTQPNTTDTLVISLQSDVVASSFQINVVLPEGVELVDDDGDYVFEKGDIVPNRPIVSEIEALSSIPNGYRILVASSKGRQFKSASGVVAYLPIKVGDLADGTYDVKFSNIKFSTIEAVSIKKGSQTLDEVTSKIVVDKSTTGIDKVTLDEIANGKVDVYNLQGQKVNNPKHGVYIINGKKVVLK